MYEQGNLPESAVTAGVSAAKHGRLRLIPIAVAAAATLGFSLIGIGTASAASPGGHVAANSHGSDSGGGDSGGTWDQTKVPLPHLPGQQPVFVLQSRTVADVEALDQTSEDAADAAMIAFYQDNTTCTVKLTLGPGDVKYTITCPHGTATMTDTSPIFAGSWVQVFRLVN